VIHLPNGSVGMDDTSGLYTVKYELASEVQHEAGVANVAQLSKHERNFLRWHCRLGHPSNGKMREMAKRSTGAPALAAIPAEVYANAKPCPVCQLTKMRKVPRPLSGSARHSNLRVFMDVWGPFRVPSAEYGYHYLIGFTHEGSGYVAVYPTKRHDASVLISTTKRYWGDMAAAVRLGLEDSTN
jgi:hypothetical protein